MSVTEILAGLGDRFQDAEPLTEGRTGTSFRAHDVEQGCSGVLKILHAEQTRGSDGMRLKRELGRQVRMTHPNLGLPSATGEAGGRVWLFRDYVDGESLRARLSREGSLPVTEALAIVAQIASGLDELHRGGMLHRDLQPGHVLLTGDDREPPRVVCIDASLAPSIDGAPALDVRGTAEYVSPEQARGKLVSFRSDLYSLGCLLHELLSGAPPFTGDVATVLEQHATASPPSPPDSLPDGGKLLSSLLAKEPRQRPFSAQQVRKALDPFLPESMRQGTARGARPAVPGVPAPAVPKKASASVPPAPRVPASESQGPADSTTEEAPDPEAGWQEEHTQQIDAQDLLEVAQGAPTGGAAPSPAPGETAKRSTPPPPPPPPAAKPASLPPPPPGSGRPPTPGGAPPPGPPGSSSAAPGAPDPRHPLPDGPPVPAEHRPSRGAGPSPLVRRVPPTVAVGVGAFLLGAVLSGTVVYLLMVDDGAAEVAMGATPDAVPTAPAPDVPPPPDEAPSAGEVLDDAGEAPSQDDDTTTDEADADDGPGAEAEEEADAPDDADEPSSEGTPSGTASGEAQADRAAAERRRRLQAQRRAQAARRRQAQQKDAFAEAQADAREAFRKRDYAAAARAYERATKLRPRHAGSFAGLGAARLAMGNAGGAVKAYVQATRLQPRNAGFHVALGRARQAAGDTVGAEQAYRRALSIDPDNASAKAALRKLN